MERNAIVRRTSGPRLAMFVRSMARLATTEEGTAGCMLMNSAMELGAADPEIAAYARDTYAQIEDWLFATVTRGQELGQISRERDARSLARYLSYNVQGMFAVARTAPNMEVMDDVAETVLSVL